MKVLLLHQHFKTPETGGAIRSYYLLQALLEHSIETIVLTTHSGKELRIHQEPGVTYYYLPIPYDNSFTFFQRIKSFLTFLVSAIYHANSLTGIRVCYAISTPLTTGLVALWLKFFKKIPYVFEVGDLWPEAPIQLGIIKSRFLTWGLYKLEKAIYRHASSIVALSPMIAEAIEKKSATRVFVIPNFADTSYYLPSSLDVTRPFRLSYIGALGLANGLDYLILAAVALQREQLPVTIAICGTGAQEDHLKNLAVKHQLQNLQFIPFQTREGVQRLLQETDGIFVSFQPVPVLETGSPNKYFDGLAAGKVVLVNVGGWMKSEVVDSGIGIALDPADPESILRMREFLGNKPMIEAMQKRARNLAESSYSRKILSARFIDIIRPFIKG